jgi:hypothetical protein
MRGKQIVSSAVCVGIVLAFAGLAPRNAAAQTISSNYDDGWTKPFCMQPYWDQKKVDNQNMRWDIKPIDRDMETANVDGSTRWSNRWDNRWEQPFYRQDTWNEADVEEHMLNWHNQPAVMAVDLSDTRPSKNFDTEWYKPYCMQPLWDEARWEEHCMNWHKHAEYRHRDTAGMN